MNVKKEKRDDVKVYIPPGRRALLASEPQSSVSVIHSDSSSSSNVSGKKNRHMKYSTISNGINELSSKSTTNKKDSTVKDNTKTLEDFGIIEYDDTLKCTVILRGFPADATESHRSSLIPSSFTEKNSMSHWMSSTELMVVFMTPSFAKIAIESTKSSRIQFHLLDDLSKSESEKYESVAKSIQKQLKPDRDTRTANRLISAALGLKVPKVKTKAIVSNVSVDSDNFVGDGWDG